ncbi:MAG: CapA family protein [Gemmatimonadota bacterium]|nr:CapA family protein [Gemmatimonadota bacterium]
MRVNLVFVLAFMLSVAQAVAAQSRSPIDSETQWTLAAVGDVIMNRRLEQFDHPGDPGFHELANVIRAADAAFMNLEQSVFRLQEFDGWPAAENGGNYEVGSPETLMDLVSMGFNLFNRANNHTTDYGVAGLRATNRLMDEMGLVHAGTGENLGWASRPGYLDTSRGRIALIGMASTHSPMSRAGSASPEVQGRPGLNALRLDRRNEGSPSTMSALRAAARAQGENASEDVNEPVRVFGTTVFPGARDAVTVSLNEVDRDRVLHEVRNATDQGDYVVVNSHSHEPGNNSILPPDWMVEFTHDVIDAGANTFIIHGPHQLRGIEIYRGRPIFYSLGNFIFQNETIDPMPADQRDRYGLPLGMLASEIYDRRFGVDENGNPTTGFPTGSQWYESVLAVTTFEGDEVTEIRLYPIELGWRADRSQRGTPRLAPDALGRKIIEHLAVLSEPFGTRIVYEDGTGVWRR